MTQQNQNYVARVQATVDLHVAQVRDLLIRTFVLKATSKTELLQELSQMTKDRELAIRDIASGAFSDYVCPVASSPESGEHLLEFHQAFISRAKSVLSLVQSQAIATCSKIRLSQGLLGASPYKIAAAFAPKVNDRAGRAWNPSKFVSLELRHAVVLARTECRLIDISRIEGRDVAVVTHPENQDLNGLAFSITGQTPDLPTYEDIKSKVFHPNSRAGVQ